MSTDDQAAAATGLSRSLAHRNAAAVAGASVAVLVATAARRHGPRTGGSPGRQAMSLMRG